MLGHVPVRVIDRHVVAKDEKRDLSNNIVLKQQNLSSLIL